MPYGSYWHDNYAATAATVGAPTYLGQAPYIGMAPTPATAHLGPLLHPLNAHMLATRVPLSPDSPPERPAT